MNYGAIRKCDITNGESVRVPSLMSGCSHHCTNYSNQEAWDFAFDYPFIGETQQEILATLPPGHISDLTLLGRKPSEPENQHMLAGLSRQVREKYPQKDIWCCTGYLLNRGFLQESRARCEVTDEMLGMIGVLVDGRFMEELEDISPAFKGSSNQRIIDVRRSLCSGHVVIKMQQSSR